MPMGIYLRQRKPIDQRFWPKVLKTDGCWIWLAGKDNYGYGTFSLNKRPHHAHRISWQLCVGPIPNKLLVLHRCDNRVCVNPTHLFLGTPQDNWDDCRAKGRNAPPKYGESCNLSKLNKYQVKEIRQRYSCGGILQRELAREYGLSRQGISDIIIRRAWRHI